MTISQMNHLVLYVRDARIHEAFYRDHLDFSTVSDDPAGRFVFMRAPGSDNHHDIAFFTVGADARSSEAGRGTVGMYHVAWEVPTVADLAAMAERLSAAGALVGSSDHGVSKSLYAHDPDGLEFEVMWRVPRQAWGRAEHEATVAPLDLGAELARADREGTGDHD